MRPGTAADGAITASRSAQRGVQRPATSMHGKIKGSTTLPAFARETDTSAFIAELALRKLQLWIRQNNYNQQDVSLIGLAVGEDD